MAKVAIIGLGYVGLPLAVAFAKRKHEVVGIDLKKDKLEELRGGYDQMHEVESEDLKAVTIDYTDDFSKIVGVDAIIVAVPTPIDEHRQPDLRPLINSSRSIAPYLSGNVIVCYESTVYPGVTEDVCKPELESAGKKHNTDFRLAYSPERVNPGDKEHTIEKIVKVVSGQDPDTLKEIAELYESVIDAGIHRAPCIKVAEAAKVIENTQRDLNIALMNELALIFDKIGIRTSDVLEAAGTKWNFLKFHPGLVGGHCIGVDPYYLTHRAMALGYQPEVILAGRRINDNMGKYVAERTVKLLIQAGCAVKGSKVLIFGLTFKENVPDFRNSKVTDIIRELREFQVDVVAHDPQAKQNSKVEEFDLVSTPIDQLPKVDAIILAVSHREFIAMDLDQLKSFYNKGNTPVLVDVRGAYSRLEPGQNGFSYWVL